MPSRSVASSTLWQVASQVTMAALSIVTIKLVVTGLSKELFGQYNTAYGYLQIFGILADFGLYAVSVREVSRVTGKERERVLGSLMVLRTIITILSLGSALTIAWLLPQWHGTPLPLGITIAALVPGFTLLAGVLRTIFQVEYKMHFVFIAEVSQRVVSVGLTALLIIAGIRQSTDIKMYLLFLLAGGAGSLVLFLLSLLFASRITRIQPCWDRALLKRLLLLASPYGIAFLCTAMYRQCDVTLISLLRPLDYRVQNADYGAVQRMMDMAYLFPTFLLNSTLPILTERDSRGEDTRYFLGKILLAVLLLGITAAFFSLLWARPLMQLLTNDQYLSTATEPGSDTALRILAGSMFFNGLIVFSFYVLLARHKWKPLVRTLAIGVVVSLISNFLLIPHLGFVGASITSLITHAILACFLLPQSIRAMPLRISQAQWRQLALYALGLAALLFLLKPFLVHPLFTSAGLVIASIGMAFLALSLGLQHTLRNEQAEKPFAEVTPEEPISLP